jgi:hypothetical protein
VTNCRLEDVSLPFGQIRQAGPVGLGKRSRVSKTPHLLVRDTKALMDWNDVPPNTLILDLEAVSKAASKIEREVFWAIGMVQCILWTDMAV